MSPERSVTYVSGTDREVLVGERGFEPPTPWSRTRCSTRLSHSPTLQRQGNRRGWRRLQQGEYSRNAGVDRALSAPPHQMWHVRERGSFWELHGMSRLYEFSEGLAFSSQLGNPPARA